MKDAIRKVLYKKLSSLPDSKALLWHDFEVAFNSATGASINDYLDDAQEVLDTLESENYVRCDQLPNKMLRFVKGLNFDEWCEIMKPTQNNNPIHIGSLTAQNVQVGNQNTMSVNVSPEELVAALNKLTIKAPEEAKSIVEKLSGYIQSGVSVAETVAKLVALVG